MRSCAQCGGEDREIVTGADSEHWVVPELRWLAGGRELTRRELGQGWRRRMVQGQAAMARDMCRDCLNLNAVRDEVWGDLKDAARRLEQAPADRYYAALCEA